MTVPVLWLYGPSGVGKTTVGWALFTRLARNGVPTGYVDTDQLAMCYAAPTAQEWAPEPASDPGRYRLRARNLDAVLANFRAAGARCVVVSGVVDPARGVAAAEVPRAALTLCRLRADPADLGERLARRGGPHDRLDEVQPDADALERVDLPGVYIDTTGRDAADVLRLVRKETGGWPAGTGPVGGTPAPAPWPAVASAGPVLWLCGPTAVGKSTVGWQVYQRVRRAGVRAAFVDLDQLGFRRPVPADDPGNHRLKAANLAAVWRTFRASGAHCLITVGPVDGPDSVHAYRAALPHATLTVCRLHAGRDQFAERVARRGRGLGPGWGIPGDELTGLPAPLLRRIAGEAAAHAAALDRTGVGDLRVDTDGRSAPDVAADILTRTGWPGGVPERA